MKPKIGDKVTLTEPIEAYYSNYCGNPKVIIIPGMIGEVKSIKVPFVRVDGYFNCVDFIVKDKFSGNPCFNNNTWTVAATDKQLKKV